MSVDPDQNLDRSAARQVTLVDRAFYVAPLSLRQILAIADHVPKLSGSRQPERRAAAPMSSYSLVGRLHTACSPKSTNAPANPGYPGSATRPPLRPG